MLSDKQKDEAGTGPAKRRKMALGRGLDALIPGIEPDGEPQGSKEFFMCAVGLIRPNRFQPRSRFSEEELDELSRSIREQGIIQPLAVRTIEDGFELIAGERRLRAAKKAGLTEVPVMVKEISDAALLEVSLVENIQRENLNPLEEAEAYHRLMTEFHLTQDQVSERVGKSRSAVANFLRLRQLPDPIKAGILEEKLSMGHARALLGAETPARQLAAFKVVLQKGLSVRETEALVRRLNENKDASRKAGPASDAIFFADLANDLSRHFGTKVQIKRQGKKGKVEMEFYSEEDLERLLNLLKGG